VDSEVSLIFSLNDYQGPLAELQAKYVHPNGTTMSQVAWAE
jgi:hypothetical protein